MTDAEIKALTDAAIQQIDGMAVTITELKAEVANLQKLLDTEREITENILNRLYDNEVSKYL